MFCDFTVFIILSIYRFRLCFNKIFQVAYLINKPCRYNARVKSKCFIKAPLRCPIILKVIRH
jgi:hypothetical protein